MIKMLPIFSLLLCIPAHASAPSPEQATSVAPAQKFEYTFGRTLEWNEDKTVVNVITYIKNNGKESCHESRNVYSATKKDDGKYVLRWVGMGSTESGNDAAELKLLPKLLIRAKKKLFKERNDQDYGVNNVDTLFNLTAASLADVSSDEDEF